ncbi:MAG TPA: hypothetical protein VEK11_18935 [Thermoanaerobaculia bacterium]|nr:hypothetical protein [Thermoanaerobaculia bacterium]
MRTLGLIAAVAILVLQLLAVHAMAGRPLHYDENEYLHASWLMANGQRIYRDFFEDHPPHLFLLLQSVLPDGELRAIDVRAWAIRSRWLCGLFGTIAVGAIALFAWRMTRVVSAPLVAAATLLASSQIWSRGLADIRAEAPTLALFWVGLVLLTWSVEPTRAQAGRAGVGIGLIFFSNIWNPKSPLEAVLAGLYFLWLVRKQWVAFAAAIVTGAIALVPLFTFTTPRDYFFFNIRLKADAVADYLLNPWVTRFFARYPMWATASPQHRWWWIVAAIVLAIIAMRVWKPADRRLAWIAIVLAISALVELRFIYPYPNLWAQYLTLIATTAALVYALLAALLPARIQFAVAIAAALVAIVPLQRKAFTDVPPSWTRYWSAQRALQTSLGPEDRVWISPPRHPVAAFDASYYWYNFRESTPSAIKRQARYPEFLPPLGFRDLPPCHLRARYIELGDWMPFLGEVCACAQNAFNTGNLAPTKSMGIFEVTRVQRDEPWLQRTRGLWSDLCRRQEVFLRGGHLNIAP